MASVLIVRCGHQVGVAYRRLVPAACWPRCRIADADRRA